MKRPAVLFLFVCVLLGTLVHKKASAEVYGQADLSYQKTTTESDTGTTQSTTFVQGYTLGIAKQLTNTISLRADVRLTQTEQDNQRTESLYPMVTLNYTPPSMYYFTFGYTRTDVAPSESNRLTTSNLNASFALPLEKWPSLAIVYNRSTNQDFEQPHEVDNVSSNIGLNTHYSYSFLRTESNLSYAFNYQTSEDRVAQTKRESPTHTAAADFTRTFLDNKLRASANIGYSWSENTSTSLAGASRFEQEIDPSTGLSRTTTTPESETLNSNQALIDGDKSSTAGINLNVSQSVGFSLQSAQNVEKIHLYVNTNDTTFPNWVDDFESQNLNTFMFKIYKSDTGSTWTEVTGVTATFDEIFQRVVFTFAETSAKYFKVVNTGVVSTPLFFVTEIEPLGFLVSTPTEEISYVIQRNFAGFNLTYSPLSRLNLGYNLNYDNTTQGLNNSETTAINQGVNANYIVWPQYLTAAAAVTTTTNSSTQDTSTGRTESETEVNSYTLTFSSNPLPTVTANLNFGLFDNRTDGTKTSQTDSVAGNLFMNLYRGVDLGLGSSLSQTKNYSDGSSTDSMSYYTNVNLIPWNDVTIVINATTFSSSTVSDSTTTESSGDTLNASVSYTPTRKFYMSAAFTIEPTTSQSYAVTWIPTRTIQMDARLGISEDLTSYGATFSWTPIQRLTMFLGYSLAQSTGTTTSDTSTVFARASLRF